MVEPSTKVLLAETDSKTKSLRYLTNDTEIKQWDAPYSTKQITEDYFQWDGVLVMPITSKRRGLVIGMGCETKNIVLTSALN